MHIRKLKVYLQDAYTLKNLLLFYLYKIQRNKRFENLKICLFYFRENFNIKEPHDRNNIMQVVSGIWTDKARAANIYEFVAAIPT